MDIDITQNTVNELKEWIKNYFEENAHPVNGPKAIIGISGGKDSAVCAKLLCDSIGPENVTCVLMMSEETKNDIDLAKYFVESYLKSKIIIVDPKYIVGLKVLFNIAVEDTVCISKQAYINITPRIRMTILYMLASTLHARVCGTGNLSESTIGYFTKWGDGACDFNPIGLFTCSEVIKIGELLSIPKIILYKDPEDGISGKTDEENLGIKYVDLDFWIRNPENNNIKFENMKEQNKHKNNPIPMFNPKGVCNIYENS